MKRKKPKIMLIDMWIGVTSYLVAILLALVNNVGTTKDQIAGYGVVMLMGGIVITIVVKIFTTYRGRYIEIGKDQLVVSRSTKKIKANNYSPEGKWIKKKDTFDVKDIVRMGYSVELYKKRLEFHQYVSGTRPNCEMVFELKNQKRIAIDMEFFTCRQQKEIFTYIYERTGLLPEGALKKIAGMTEMEKKC